MTNAELLKDVIEFSAWMQQNPTLEAPSISITYSLYGLDETTTKERIAELARTFPKTKKNFGGSYFDLEARIGKNLTLLVCCYRSQVCQKVVTGTKHHEAELRPAYDEELVDWVCPKSLFDNTPEEMKEITNGTNQAKSN